MQTAKMIGIPAIKARIAYIGITQERLAITMGLERSSLTRYLRAVRPMPEGFEARVMEALDLLERAEAAARDARERVLAEGTRERVLVGGEG